MLTDLTVHVSRGRGKIREHRRYRSTPETGGYLGHTVCAVMSWRSRDEGCALGAHVHAGECCRRTNHLSNNATLEQVDLPDPADLWSRRADLAQSISQRAFRE